MNTRDYIQRLIGKSENSSENSSLYALKDLGLLTERHTQNRYDEDYSLLFDEDDLIKIKLADEDVNILVYYFLYRLTNKFPFAVTTAWVLGNVMGILSRKGLLNY